MNAIRDVTVVVRSSKICRSVIRQQQNNMNE